MTRGYQKPFIVIFCNDSGGGGKRPFGLVLIDSVMLIHSGVCMISPISPSPARFGLAWIALHPDDRQTWDSIVTKNIDKGNMAFDPNTFARDYESFFSRLSRVQVTVNNYGQPDYDHFKPLIPADLQEKTAAIQQAELTITAPSNGNGIQLCNQPLLVRDDNPAILQLLGQLSNRLHALVISEKKSAYTGEKWHQKGKAGKDPVASTRHAKWMKDEALLDMLNRFILLHAQDVRNAPLMRVVNKQSGLEDGPNTRQALMQTLGQNGHQKMFHKLEGPPTIWEELIQLFRNL